MQALYSNSSYCMSTPITLLWVACLENDPAQIKAVIDANPSISMQAFLRRFHETAHEQVYVRNPKSLPSEEAIAIALEEYRPHAHIFELDQMLQRLCMTMSTPDSLRTFLKLYAHMLVPNCVSDALFTASHHLRTNEHFRCSEIVEACIGNLCIIGYWRSFEVCCHDQRPDLVEKLLGTYDYPLRDMVGTELPIGLFDCCKNNYLTIARLVIDKYGGVACEILIAMCGNAGATKMLEMVLSEYAELATPVIASGFRSACDNKNLEMIHMYLDYVMKLGKIDALQTCGIDCLNRAVQCTHAGVVNVLLCRCKSMFQFRDGHRARFVNHGFGEYRETEGLLKATYGPRLTIEHPYWIVACMDDS